MRWAAVRFACWVWGLLRKSMTFALENSIRYTMFVTTAIGAVILWPPDPADESYCLISLDQNSTNYSDLFLTFTIHTKMTSKTNEWKKWFSYVFVCLKHANECAFSTVVIIPSIQFSFSFLSSHCATSNGHFHCIATLKIMTSIFHTRHSWNDKYLQNEWCDFFFLCGGHCFSFIHNGINGINGIWGVSGFISLAWNCSWIEKARQNISI